eukprot:2446958-Rhodomonas_salina.1
MCECYIQLELTRASATSKLNSHARVLLDFHASSVAQARPSLSPALVAEPGPHMPRGQSWHTPRNQMQENANALHFEPGMRFLASDFGVFALRPASKSKARNHARCP